MPANSGIQHICTSRLDLLRQGYNLFGRGTVFDQVRRRNPVNDHETRPTALAHGANDLNGKTMAVFHTAPPFVGALIGVENGKFVEQIPLRAHNFDSVKPRSLRVGRGRGEILDCSQNVVTCHFARDKTVNWRADRGGGNAAFGFAITPRVQDLRTDKRPLGMDGITNRAQRLCFLGIIQARTVRVKKPFGIGRKAARNNQRHLAPCALGIKGDLFGDRIHLRFKARVH